MNRDKYFDEIESRLGFLAYRLELRGGLNILNFHLHSENFYKDFFNLLFGWELTNRNCEDHNAAGLDLLDTTNKIIIQVSATASKQKIDSALSKDISDYTGYAFKFISISKNASELKKKTFENPYDLVFSPDADIYDISSILSYIMGKDIDFQAKCCKFLREELDNRPDFEVIESNLANIIAILARENWSKSDGRYETLPYDVDEKIKYNQLDASAIIIHEYKIYYSRIDNIYTEFDKHGSNRSASIFAKMREAYIKSVDVADPDQRFMSVTDKIIKSVIESSNFRSIPEEEVRLCVEILTVDAFIRCKIFKNPRGGFYAGA